MSVTDLLEAAVAGVGGSTRPGQVSMARAVADAVDQERHLLVQAGTGTGKSLAYLVPAVAHAQATGKPVVVATATLALQGQIVDRDMPRLAEALVGKVDRTPTYALVKGRRNYLCRHKLGGGFPVEDEADALPGLGGDPGASSGSAGASSRLGAEVVRLREWAEETEGGDRDELVPGVSERAWRQVSVSAQECLGSSCPMVAECFVERSRDAAKDVDVVVTNHSFMAIDAFEGRAMLPEHDLLVVDEAHELVDRVTSTVTDEITGAGVLAAAHRAARLADTADLAAAAADLTATCADLPEGRLEALPASLVAALSRVHECARALQSAMKPSGGPGGGEPADGQRAVARAAVDEVFDTSGRLLDQRELDVAWVGQDPRRGASLRVAPMSVAMQLRDKVFGERTVVMTSATLELGGTFDAVAGTLGLRGAGAPEWTGLDVGSPFDYARQGIAYVARHLPQPGRDGPPDVLFDEIEALVRAAGGRTLGLFSSMRAAQAATAAMRDRLGGDIEVLCQGEDQIGTLVRRFATHASTCLFGTLTLWQGVDVPGSSCQLVIIDRIPFPRPDDPLASARSQAIARMGGNGFMAVSATHAALRLAQGAGRLIRRGDDRGVVAFLDPRMMTARYAGFLQASLPPFWPTTDRDLVLSALARLDEAAPPPMPVATPARRGTKGALAPDLGTVAVDGPASAARDAAQHPGPGRVAEATSSGAPAPEAARTGVTAGHGWSREQDEELSDGLDLGLDVDELAEHLGVEAEAVRARISRLRLGSAG